MTLLKTTTSGGTSRDSSMTAFTLALLVVFFFSTANCSFSETAEFPEKLFQFAESLFREAEYYRAITEYKRFISYYPENQLAETAVYQIGNCYFQAEKWDEAIKSFEDFNEKHPESPLVKDTLQKMGEGYLKKGDKENSKKIFDLINEKYPKDEAGNKAKISLGTLYLEHHEWNKASEVFSRVEERSRYKTLADRLIQGSKEAERLPSKSPVLAGTLSALIPGAGQLYTERRLDSLVAFLLNGVFILGAVESFNKNIYVAGGILSFFELGWYSGNIYNAISDAHKYNRDTRKRFIEELKINSNLSDNLSLKKGPIIFSYRIEF